MTRIFQLLVLAGALAAAGPAAAEEALLRLAAEPSTASRDLLRLTVENVSSEPRLLYLDARLATVELLRGTRRLARCSAPADTERAERDDRRFVSLEPGQGASAPLDLRYLCFRRLSALGEADRLRVSYRARAASDQAGRPAVTSVLGPLDLDRPAEGSPRAAPPALGAALTLRQVGAQPDLTDGSRVPVTVELAAPPRARLPLVVRPELFGFRVTGPTGEASFCGLPPSKVQPLRDFYERLGRRMMTLDLARLCEDATFDRPGIYEVRPSFRSDFDGRDAGYQAWTGEVSGATFLVRIQRWGRRPGEPVEIEVPDGAARGGGAGDAP